MNARTTPVSRWAWIARNALVLLASTAATACLTQEDADIADEESITSELATGASLYKCMYPMCGGVGITFDSRSLGLRSCAYDARANVLDCEAHAVDSPRMPRAFWGAHASQLTCSDGLRFSCAGTTSNLVSCACTSTAAAGGVTYGPVITIKPKG